MAIANTVINPSLFSRGASRIRSTLTSSSSASTFSSTKLIVSAAAVAAATEINVEMVQKSTFTAASMVVSSRLPNAPERTKEAVAPAAPTLALAGIWQEIQGSDDWKGLVDPLHPVLCQEIIRYGELVNACYKAFDLDPTSRRHFSCKYSKKRILKEVGLGSSGYDVTKYIYANPDIAIPTQQPCRSCWMGYVAVSSDSESRRLGRRDIVVAFRGTVTNAEWLANFMSNLTPARLDPHDPRPEVKVASGFLSMYTSDDSTCRFSQGSCREQLLKEMTRLITMYKDEEVSITLAGHSMGSSLALLLGYDLAELGLNKKSGSSSTCGSTIPITVYSFAGPRVGNMGFKERCEELGVKVLRVVNVKDPITKLPGVFLNEEFRVLAERYELPWGWSPCSCYAHVGVELALEFFQMKNPSCVHDLEHYLELLRCSSNDLAEVVRSQSQVQRRGEESDLVQRAKGFFSMDSWPWRDAVLNVSNLVQSLGI